MATTLFHEVLQGVIVSMFCGELVHLNSPFHVLLEPEYLWIIELLSPVLIVQFQVT